VLKYWRGGGKDSFQDAALVFKRAVSGAENRDSAEAWHGLAEDRVIDPLPLVWFCLSIESTRFMALLQVP
jgi:hypothetical protein